ncbi:50S ribosomal protein L6 [Rubrimonas cliftonensis]|uniref:Large ribosomal subunit protein uL6 n=1 Tax=Rubrimonas cliftonensis TaxID=89524 RepID=A0A1H4FKF3_9RHOB|nr:50S ribosomal protein L6 [Rubrimonas cliftonensis]SEA97290.1 LSU ribosomal protein L6P [Rubrimonas cliftonensis]
MSRIGKKPIEAPKGVEWKVSGQKVEAKGPKGVRVFTATDDVDVLLDGTVITVRPRGDSKRARQQWGMTRTQIANLAQGVTEGFKKELEIVGVGYRAAVAGKTLKLSLGYSHDVEFAIPEGIEIKCAKPTEVEITGSDQQQVGQVAAEIRDWRRPEPYKGKGVRYKNEYIFRKEGKKK